MGKTRQKRIYLIGGARPNFVKIAALSHAFKRYKRSRPKALVLDRIIHTGQHYDARMTRLFFQDLRIPPAYVNLKVGSGSHAEQTAKIMFRFERLLLRAPCDLVVVVGDVNSTLACSLVAAKMQIPVAHVEAGLRSFDPAMPEEINRRVTDAVSDYLFTTTLEANQNLRREGVPRDRIYFVGNVMVDTLLASQKSIRRSRILRTLGLGRRDYAVLTLHRPSNVDREKDFRSILEALEWIQNRVPIIFPVHPRTQACLRASRLGRKLHALSGIRMTPPMGYLDFIRLMRDARLVLTDSGGIQEETTTMGVPCLTLRDNTERGVTMREGTNVLAGRKAPRIIKLTEKILSTRMRMKRTQPRKWDGHAAERIVQILATKLGI